MTRRLASARFGAFTLVETMIGAMVSMIVLAALAAGAVSLLRSYTASEDYSDAQASQLRILDYISRDVRRALAATATTSPAKLTLTVPDQYAAAEPSRTFKSPTLFTQGTFLGATYGTTPVTVEYYLSGTNFMRREGGTATVIARSVSDFQPAFDPADPAGKTVKTTFTFAPIFRRVLSSDARAATTMTSRVVMRTNQL
jgi:Tfp pilus assembly protein PilW